MWVGQVFVVKILDRPALPTLEWKLVRVKTVNVCVKVCVCVCWFCVVCFVKQKTKQNKTSLETQNHELREEIKSSFFSRISQLISNSTTYTHTTHTAKRG